MGKNTTEDGAFDQAVASLDGILRSRSPAQAVHSSRRSWRLRLVVPILIVMLGVAALAAVGVGGARRWATRSLGAGTAGLFGDRVTVSLPPADRAPPRSSDGRAIRVTPMPGGGVPVGADQPAQAIPTPLPTPSPTVHTAAVETAAPTRASRGVHQRRRRMTAASTPPSDPAEQAGNEEDEGNATTKRQADEAERRAAIDAIRALRLR